MKQRLDVLLAERGLAETRAQARHLILAGRVRVDGQVLCKGGVPVGADCRLEVEAAARFVGRGGEKLEAALAAFGLDPRGCVCLDIGASTGGFTDCLLQHGAARVYAVDVGKGQLHWKLRQDARVIVMDETNARHLRPGSLPEEADWAVADVSFISLTKIMSSVVSLLKRETGVLVTLIKPQFEAGRAQVGRGGVVRDEAVHREVVERIGAFAASTLGLRPLGTIPSPIRGGRAGNIEFLAAWRVAATHAERSPIE
jgi:23S rRNA (cytidine1920-2'-O)/16S rRNA (cytidine1409-2'-O)-methyltransferase